MGKDRTPNEDEIAYAEMSQGSVLLYTGTVLHGVEKTLQIMRLGLEFLCIML